jgi:hypothetical protein
VPLRDFMSYDIGRYYWAGALLSMCGAHGLVATRSSALAFEGVCLFIGLGALARSAPKEHFGWWALSAVGFASWMCPEYRIFDIAVGIVPVAALSVVIERPSVRRWFFVGVVVGLVGVLGRNHGLYSATASCGVMAWLALGNREGPATIWAAAAWGAGVIIGYLPVLGMMAFVPGFAAAFLAGFRIYFEMHATNLTLALPFPWRLPLGHFSWFDFIHGVLEWLCFIGIVVYGVAGIVWAIRCRLVRAPFSSVFVASVFVALPYSHLAYSRADLIHLASSVIPVLVGAFAWLSGQTWNLKWPGALLLVGLSMVVSLPLHPRAHWRMVDEQIAGDALLVSPELVKTLAGLEALTNKYAPVGRPFAVLPNFPGAYAAFGRKSPLWELYAVFPRGQDFQREEIRRLASAKPGFVVILDCRIDGRNELRYQKTHELIERYVRDNFTPLPDRELGDGYKVYRAR